MDKEQFGRRLSQLRRQQGMSQKELAEALSVSVSAVSKWEHGSNFPDLSIIHSLAEILQVSCDDLLSPEQLPDGEASKEQDRETELPPQAEGKAGERQRLQGKKLPILLAAGAALFLLLCFLIRPAFQGYLNQETVNKNNPQQVAARYIDHPMYGKMYEIAFVMEDVDLAFIDLHINGLKAALEQELEEGTQGIRASYYENVEDAEAWEATPVFGDIFLNVQ